MAKLTEASAMPEPETTNSILPLSAIALIFCGPALLLLAPVNGFNILWASGAASLGISSFIQLYLGGLKNADLDVGLESNPLANVISKFTLKGRFGAAPAFFVFSWIMLTGGYFLYDGLNGKVFGSLKSNPPNKNEFEITPVVVGLQSRNPDVDFKVSYKGQVIGRFTREEAVSELRRLASDTSSENGSGNNLTRKFLRDCAFNRETCQQPDILSVKVSFSDTLGAGNAYACKNSEVLASYKIRPGVWDLSGTTGNPDNINGAPVAIKSITAFQGVSNKCLRYPNWIQVDKRYIGSFGISDNDGFTDGFLASHSQ